VTSGQTLPSPTDILIGQTLVEELAALERFHSLLLQEQEVLTHAHADKLPPLVEQKSALAGRLGQFLAERERSLTASGFPTGREGMDAWLAVQPEKQRLSEIWARLLHLAEEARRQQALNGKLIAIQLQHTQQALAALMSAGGHPLTYGPDGQQRVGGGGRTLGSA
jgi:flagellar biosynthesis protein FlgN